MGSIGGTKGFPPPTDSAPMSEDEVEEKKVRSTVDRVQASFSRGKRKVIGFPSKLREMMSFHPWGKGEKGSESKLREGGEEEESEESQKGKDVP